MPAPEPAARPAALAVRALLQPQMLLLHALAAVVVTACILLGQWQLGAWHQHRQDRSAQLMAAAPVPLQQVFGPDAPFPGAELGRKVSFSGVWRPHEAMYVTDQLQHGRSGTWVVVPLSVCPAADQCHNASAMLVVLGWTDAAAADLPTPKLPQGLASVTGWLQPGDGSNNPDPQPGDRVLPALRIADALQLTTEDLYSGYVLGADLGPAATGLEPVTPASLPKAPTFTALRNLLYAIEWWVFGGFAIYFWLRWCRDEVVDAWGGDEEPAAPDVAEGEIRSAP